MYHAFHVLTEAYEQGKDGKREEQDQAAGSFLAANILGAFGIENALKALIRREGKDPDDLKNKDRHNLKKLYEMLASETQRSICEKGCVNRHPGKWRSQTHPSGRGYGRTSREFSGVALQGIGKRLAGSL